MDFERARSDEQKQERINEILGAVERLLESADYENITLADIAKEASFTRSNLYKYFTTKEDIFLRYISYKVSLWADGVITMLVQNPEASAEKFCELWTDSLMGARKELDLLPLLYTLLEKKASETGLVEFKKANMNRQNRIAELLTGIFPWMSMKDAWDFISVAIALAGGLFPMDQANKQHRELLEKNGIPHGNMDFRTVYTASLLKLLKH